MRDSAYRTYVISLARHPQKRSAFLTRNRETGLPFEIFDGIDGSALAFEEFVRDGLVKANAAYYTLGQLGAAAAHRSLWIEADRDQASLLIFEDDAYCRRDIVRQIEDVLAKLDAWDIVLLGYNTDAVLDVRISALSNFAGFFSNEAPSERQLETFTHETCSVVPVRLNNAFGACAYLISPRGARKLLAIFPLDNRRVRIPGNLPKFGRESFHCMTFDTVMNTLYPSSDAYAVIPPLALPPNNPSASATKNSSVAGGHHHRAAPPVNDLRALSGAFVRARRVAAAAVAFLRSGLSRRR